MSTAVRSRVFKISAAAIAIGLCLFSQDDVSASIKERRVERLNAQIESVYTTEYQQMMDDEMADERDAKVAHGRQHLHQDEPVWHEHLPRLPVRLPRLLFRVAASACDRATHPWLPSLRGAVTAG